MTARARSAALPLPEHVTLADSKCWCGSAELRVVVPGDQAIRHRVAGALRRPVALRGWCSVACAREDGWPWLHSERLSGRKRRKAT